jgi:murein DD-endopeptidase MepM/ murein hydrolase activator NlpD
MKEKKKYITRLKNKYRLVILNDDTFEEKLSIKLSLINVFVLVGGSVMLLSVGMIFLIAFTPLREYIPGYSSNEVRRDALKLDMRADSLSRQLALHNQQLRTIQKIIKGEDIDSAYSEVEDSGIVKPESDALEASVMENNLREFVETEDRFNIPTNQSALSHFSFFTPLNGVVTSSFNPKENHLAVDVVAEKNAPVKACLGGSVLLAQWTSETGYALVIQHNQNLISVYKHNSALLKSQGDIVRTGEVIALIGNSGEQSTGPHLHFELWHMGNAVNPESYISF